MIRTISQTDFAWRIISRYTSAEPGMMNAADMLLPRLPEPGGQQNAMARSIRNISLINRTITENTILNLHLHLNFLNTIFTKSIREIYRNALRQIETLDKTTVLTGNLPSPAGQIRQIGRGKNVLPVFLGHPVQAAGTDHSPFTQPRTPPVSAQSVKTAPQAKAGTVPPAKAGKSPHGETGAALREKAGTASREKTGALPQEKTAFSGSEYPRLPETQNILDKNRRGDEPQLASQSPAFTLKFENRRAQAAKNLPSIRRDGTAGAEDSHSFALPSSSPAAGTVRITGARFPKLPFYHFWQPDSASSKTETGVSIRHRHIFDSAQTGGLPADAIFRSLTSTRLLQPGNFKPVQNGFVPAGYPQKDPAEQSAAPARTAPFLESRRQVLSNPEPPENKRQTRPQPKPPENGRRQPQPKPPENGQQTRSQLKQTESVSAGKAFAPDKSEAAHLTQHSLDIDIVRGEADGIPFTYEQSGTLGAPVTFPFSGPVSSAVPDIAAVSPPDILYRHSLPQLASAIRALRENAFAEQAARDISASPLALTPDAKLSASSARTTPTDSRTPGQKNPPGPIAQSAVLHKKFAARAGTLSSGIAGFTISSMIYTPLMYRNAAASPQLPGAIFQNAETSPPGVSSFIRALLHTAAPHKQEPEYPAIGATFRPVPHYVHETAPTSGFYAKSAVNAHSPVISMAPAMDDVISPSPMNRTFEHSRKSAAAPGGLYASAPMVYKKEPARQQQSPSSSVPLKINEDIEFIKKTVKASAVSKEIRETNMAVNLPGSALPGGVGHGPSVFNGGDRQVNAIAEMVYRALERRLRSEKMRKGLL